MNFSWGVPLTTIVVQVVFQSLSFAQNLPSIEIIDPAEDVDIERIEWLRESDSQRWRNSSRQIQSVDRLSGDAASSSSNSTMPSGSPSWGLGFSYLDRDTGWVGRNVSMSSFGANHFQSPYDVTVFSHFDLNHTAAALFTVDPQKASPMAYQIDHNPADPQDVHSARDADVHVSISETGTSLVRTIHIRKYSMHSSQGPDSEYTYEHQTNWGNSFSYVRVSNNGQRVVATAQNPHDGSTDLMIFSQVAQTTELGIPEVMTLPVHPEEDGRIFSLDLSGDGNTAVIGRGFGYVVYDVHAKRIVQAIRSVNGPASLGLSISDDGRVIAFGTNQGHVRVWEKNGSGYFESFVYVPELHGFPTFARAIAVSDDGRSVAFGSGRSYPSRTMGMGCLQKDSEGNWQMLVDEVMTSPDGSEHYQNTPMQVAIDEFGTTFALASLGDQGGHIPEVQVFRCRAGVSKPFYTLDLPGSAWEVALSRDAGWVAAANKEVHANELGSGGGVHARRLPRE